MAGVRAASATSRSSFRRAPPSRSSRMPWRRRASPTGPSRAHSCTPRAPSATSSWCCAPPTTPPTTSASSARSAPRSSAAATTTCSATRCSKAAPGRTTPPPHPTPPTGSSPPGLAFLLEIHESRQWRSPSELLDRIVRDRRALELGFADGRPRDVWRRIRFVIDQARAWSEATGGSLRHYLHWVEQQTAEGSRVAESVLPETDDDAVRIMTIHAAKGLEFPITIVSGLSARPGGMRSPVEVHFPKDGGPVGYRMGKDVITEEFEAAVPIDEQMGYDERLRLLYVACTRACDHLVVSLHRVERKNPPAKNSSRTNAEILIAGMGARLDVLPDIGGDPEPRPLDPATVPAPPPDFATWEAERATALAGGQPSRGGRGHRPHRRRGPRLGRRGRGPGAGRPAGPAEPVRWPHPRPGVARVAGGGSSRAGAVGHGGSRTAEAAARPRPAAMAEGPVRHGGGPGGARRAADDRPGHRRRARRCRRGPVPGRGRARPSRRRPRAWSRTRSRRRWCGQPPPTRTGARCTPARRSATGCSRATSTCSTGATTAWSSSTTRRPASADPDDLDRRVAGYRLQGAAYAVAVGRATGEPVVRVVFLFLTPHGAVERDLGDLPAAMADVERLVAEGAELVTP